MEDQIRAVDRLMTDVREAFISQAEAEERFLIGGRKPKWRRVLRALWRVKNA